MVSSDIKELSSLSTNNRTIVFKLSPENTYTALMALQLFFLARTVLSYNIPVQEILSFLEVSSVILSEEKKKKRKNKTRLSIHSWEKITLLH